ncbi:hypothetical protein RKD35_004504 [Streptomyces albogriseolus]
MEELVIRDADVVDGSGDYSYRADVVVDGGRIVSIVKEAADAGCQRPKARRELDAEGLVLAPGFIDMHAHSDLALLRDPDHSAKAAQGVTLEVLGQDGLSYAPVDDRTLGEVRRAIAGWNGPGDDVDVDWRSVGEYLDRLDRGIAVNAAYLIPQGTVRALAVGWEDREATPEELDRMRQLVAEGMEQGAVGMSSGLTYTPGMYAPDAELTELCRVVASYGGYYCPHHRSYGAGALEAYAEMVALTREAGCPLHLAHATMNFGVNKGRAPELLALLDEALDAGADITLDTYPYTPGCTTLVALLPSWASEGGPEEILRRLADEATAERIRHDLEVTGSDGCHGVPVEWEDDRDLRGGRPGAGRVRGPYGPSGGAGARGDPVGGRAGAAAEGPARPDDPPARGPRGERAGDHAPPGAHGRLGRHSPGRQAAPAGVRDVPPLPRPLRAGAGGAVAGGVRGASDLAPGGAAAAAGPGASARGVQGGPGAVRPADGGRRVHLRRTPDAAHGHPVRAGRRAVRDRGRAAHGRAGGAGGAQDSALTARPAGPVRAWARCSRSRSGRGGCRW